MVEDNEVELIILSETNQERRIIQIFEEIIIDERWETKRKETFAIFCLQFFSIGMEFTIIQSTLWPYVKKGDGKPEN